MRDMLHEYGEFLSSFHFILASSENTTEDNLLQTLLSDYNTYVRPVQDPSQALGVSLGVAMKQIIDLVSPGYWLIWLW